MCSRQRAEVLRTIQDAFELARRAENDVHWAEERSEDTKLVQRRIARALRLRRAAEVAAQNWLGDLEDATHFREGIWA